MRKDTSLLLKLRERLQEVPTEAYGSMGMPDAVRDFRDSVIDHIDDLLHKHCTAKAVDATESLRYQESPNSCGKIDAAEVGTAKQGGCEPPIRIAVDPWQGLGKTWSDK